MDREVTSIRKKSEPKPLNAQVPVLLTLTEVAELLRITPKSIYNMVSRKQIPFRRVNRGLRFELSEIDEWTKRERSE